MRGFFSNLKNEAKLEMFDTESHAKKFKFSQNVTCNRATVLKEIIFSSIGALEMAMSVGRSQLAF